MNRAVRRGVVTAVLLAGVCGLTIGGATPASGQDPDGQGVRGTVGLGADVVQGVRIAVETEAGRPVGEALTGDDGSWQVVVPQAGTYQVSLDRESLPAEMDLADPERSVLTVRVQPNRFVTVLFPLDEGEARLVERVLPGAAQAAANGVKLGLIIAITAIGLSLIYGTTRLINFAHGEMVTVGAVVAFFFNSGPPGLPLVVAGVLGIGTGMLIGGVQDAGLWRPLRRRGIELTEMLVITIGVSLFMRYVILFLFGGRSRPYAQYAVQRGLELGPIRVAPRDLVVMGLSLTVLIGVGLVLQRTRLGKSMRAVADNSDLAESSGIHVERVNLLIWVFGGGLAALGGVFLGVVENVNYLMGFRMLFLMFAGVLLGGIGTAYGAIVGSLMVGLTVELSTLFVAAELKFVWALAAVILILLYRPQGLFGYPERIG